MRIFKIFVRNEGWRDTFKSGVLSHVHMWVVTIVFINPFWTKGKLVPLATLLHFWLPKNIDYLPYNMASSFVPVMSLTLSLCNGYLSCTADGQLSAITPGQLFLYVSSAGTSYKSKVLETFHMSLFLPAWVSWYFYKVNIWILSSMWGSAALGKPLFL